MKSTKKSVLVIGSSDRLGRAIALYLSECGYDIIIHYYKDEEGARKTLSMIERNGKVASLIQGDITNSEGINGIFSRLKTLISTSSISPLTSIVNCASVFIDSSIDEVDEVRFDTDQAIHQKAPFFLTKGLYRYSKEENIHTSIIHLSDAGIIHPGNRRPSYYIAKSALEVQIKILAVSVGPFVRVNGVAPGLIIANNESERAYFLKRGGAVPLKRLSTIVDVASSVEFLITNNSITGQIIKVDSGESLL